MDQVEAHKHAHHSDPARKDSMEPFRRCDAVRRREGTNERRSTMQWSVSLSVGQSIDGAKFPSIRFYYCSLFTCRPAIIDGHSVQRAIISQHRARRDADGNEEQQNGLVASGRRLRITS